MNAGCFQDSVGELQALHRSAERHAILGTELFCAYDQSVILGTPLMQSEDSSRSILALDPDGPPSIWSMRVRALQAAGLHDEARATLSAVSAAALAKLPCDRDYLGTLGALARSALALGALDYAAALYELLAPYPRLFAAHSSFFCEGSVSQLLGLLAQALSRHTDARAHLEAGIEISVRAGFVLCAVQARFELARFLLKRGDAADRPRARALERDANDEAQRIGLPRLASPSS
jgi:tetratricopeptide (TPR) repeat protein